jgi:hypothetical protein
MKKMRVRAAGERKRKKCKEKNENLALWWGRCKKCRKTKYRLCLLCNKKKKKVIRSMSRRVSSNSLKSQQVCYILHPCAEALFAFVTRDDG